MNTKGKIDLLHCPFCGGEVVEEDFMRVIFYKCQNKKCGAIVNFNNEMVNNMPSAAAIFWNAREADKEKRSKGKRMFWRGDDAE